MLLCTGKVYYDIMAEAAKRAGRPAVVRLEQLYSFPEMELRHTFEGTSGSKELVWAQEEPRNMGAWYYLEDRLKAICRGSHALGMPAGRSGPARPRDAAHSRRSRSGSWRRRWGSGRAGVYRRFIPGRPRRWPSPVGAMPLGGKPRGKRALDCLADDVQHRFEMCSP